MDLVIRLSSGQPLDRPPQIFLAVSLCIILLSGAALWPFGCSAHPVGASNVLFGYFGYLVARGWYERGVTALLVALLTLGLYGGMVRGVLPMRSYISWEGHVFGLLAGMLVAQLATSRPVFCLSSQSSGA